MSVLGYTHISLLCLCKLFEFFAWVEHLAQSYCDCYLSTNNLGAHHFHLNCDAFGDLCLRNFPLAAHVPLLALWRCRMILSGFFLLSLQLRKSWKILYQKSFKDFFLSALGNFPSSPRLCLVLSCTNNVSLGTQCTWEATHVLILVVNHCGRWYSNDQSWFLTGLMLGVRTRMLLAFHLFFWGVKDIKDHFSKVVIC